MLLLSVEMLINMHVLNIYGIYKYVFINLTKRVENKNEMPSLINIKFDAN